MQLERMAKAGVKSGRRMRATDELGEQLQDMDNEEASVSSGAAERGDEYDDMIADAMLLEQAELTNLQAKACARCGEVRPRAQFLHRAWARRDGVCTPCRTARGTFDSSELRMWASTVVRVGSLFASASARRMDARDRRIELGDLSFAQYGCLLSWLAKSDAVHTLSKVQRFLRKEVDFDEDEVSRHVRALRGSASETKLFLQLVHAASNLVLPLESNLFFSETRDAIVLSLMCADAHGASASTALVPPELTLLQAFAYALAAHSNAHQSPSMEVLACTLGEPCRPFLRLASSQGTAPVPEVDARAAAATAATAAAAATTAVAAALENGLAWDSSLERLLQTSPPRHAPALRAISLTFRPGALDVCIIRRPTVL